MLGATNRIPVVLIGLTLILCCGSAAYGSSLGLFSGTVESLTISPSELGKEWRMDVDAIIEDMAMLPQVKATGEDAEFAQQMITVLRKASSDFKLKKASNLMYYRKSADGSEDIFDIKILVYESAAFCKAAWEFMYPTAEGHNIEYLTSFGDVAVRRNDGKLAFRRANVMVSALPLGRSERAVYLATAFDTRILKQISPSNKVAVIAPKSGPKEEGAFVFTDHDLQKYGKPNVPLEKSRQDESSNQFAIDDSKKDVNYQTLLVGTWSSKDEDQESTFTLLPDGTFHGVTKKRNKVTWKYAGNWHVSEDRLIWIYKDNTPQRRSPGSQDNDEIVTVHDDEFIIQEGSGGMLNQFFRVK